MWWFCLIFSSPPNFCRTLPFLHALNLTHSLMLKQIEDYKNCRENSQKPRLGTSIKLHVKPEPYRTRRSFMGLSLIEYLLFSCAYPLTFLLLPLSLSLSLHLFLSSSLSLKWLSLLLHMHMPRHSPALASHPFPIPALN